MKAIHLYLFFSLLGLPLWGQQRCQYSPSHIQAYLHAFEEALRLHMAEQPQGREQVKLYKIPVIFHVVHGGEAVGEGSNLAAAQIHSQIEVLNEDFGAPATSLGDIRNDFLHLAADAKIEFFLATHAPDGRVLAEPGIQRHRGHRVHWTRTEVNESLKPLTLFDPYRYLNIWTVNPAAPNYIAEAQWPSSGAVGIRGPTTKDTDGIVVSYSYVGSIEKYPQGNYTHPQFNLGRTITHEVGHWLGLRHTFENCEQGDYVEDTPSQVGHSAGCPQDSKRSCGSLDLWENFMDYTDDACMGMFTHGQVARMRTVIAIDSMRNSVANQGQPSLQPLEEVIRIYPNPTQGMLSVDLSFMTDPQQAHLTLFDVAGKKVWRIRPDRRGTTKLDLSNLTKGMYMLRYQRDLDGYSLSRKVVIW